MSHSLTSTAVPSVSLTPRDALLKFVIDAGVAIWQQHEADQQEKRDEIGKFYDSIKWSEWDSINPRSPADAKSAASSRIPARSAGHGPETDIGASKPVAKHRSDVADTSLMTSAEECSDLDMPSIRRVPKQSIRASSCCWVQALFFEVTAEKTDQRCSTS
jgi:hypothetical protein